MSLSFAVPALIGVALLGFLAGLFVLRIKNRWCPQCGLRLRCPECDGPHDAVRRTPGSA